MTGLEAAAAVGQVVARRAGREWLAARAATCGTARTRDLVYEGQQMLGADRLHKSTKINWVPRSDA
jgi:hypothetical protein